MVIAPSKMSLRASTRSLLAGGCFGILSVLAANAGVSQDAAAYVDAIARLNDVNARQGGRATEAQLGTQLPATVKSALRRVLDAKPEADLANALLRCGEAALDLDQVADFEAVRARLAAVSEPAATKLGRAVSRPRFIVRGIGEFQDGYLDQFAEIFDTILTAYDEVFGFKEFSKVPGKKLRVRVHLEATITQPPHFAPEFPWHSEIDFPVIDLAVLRSPTPQGQFLFYGLCHELGHVIAMWGDLRTMEDHHSWAHYTGVTIVEHLSQKAKDKPFMEALRDVRWRSLALERALPDNQTPPSQANAPGVMALLISLHDSVGPKAIGAALNRMDELKKAARVNYVRYYHFADFRKALDEVCKEPGQRTAIAKAFGK